MGYLVTVKTFFHQIVHVPKSKEKIYIYKDVGYLIMVQISFHQFVHVHKSKDKHQNVTIINTCIPCNNLRAVS